MKKGRSPFLAGALIGGLLFTLISPASANDLPASLDALFPPQSEEPVLLYAMMSLGDAYSAIQMDLESGEFEQAIEDVALFRSLYLELAAMVPEWTEKFPLGPLDALEAAVTSGSPEDGLAELGGLRRVCGSCHGANMVAVQQKYHWGDFRSIAVVDPVSGRSGTYPMLKWAMQDSLSGLVNESRHGHQDKAVQHYEAFSQRLYALKQTCATCHDTERSYYVDDATLKVLGRLGMAMNQQPIQPAQVRATARELNLQICFQCHLVHMPAAFSQGH